MMVSRKMVGLAALCATLMGSAAFAADSVPANVKAAVADPGRPPADIARDADRKPAEAVAFSGIKPGQVVVDLVPGGGYYTRILAKLVGPKGHVYMLVPLNAGAPGQARLQQQMKLKKGEDAKLAVDDALAIQNISEYANVETLWESLTVYDGLFSIPQQVDAVWTSDNYHDLHNDRFVGPQLDFTPEDPARAPTHLDMAHYDKLIFGALKPGGTLLVIDHAAAKGAGFTQTGTLHRADPDAVKQEILSAGFVLDGESQILANAADDHSKNIRDASLRGKTDQFVLRFKKPANAANTDKRPPKNGMSGYYGNTVRTGGGAEDFTRRWVSYHPDGTYNEFGVSGAAVQSGKYYWDAEGHNCMIHQYPITERQGVVCHETAINKKAGDHWTQNNGNGVDRPYRLEPGYTQPKVSEFDPKRTTSQ